jgi:hypothetical protein
MGRPLSERPHCGTCGLPLSRLPSGRLWTDTAGRCAHDAPLGVVVRQALRLGAPLSHPITLRGEGGQRG